MSNQKGVVVGLIFVIVILTVALAYVLIVKKAEAPVMTETPKTITDKTTQPVLAEKPPTQTSPAAVLEEVPVTNKNIYTNTDFGFQLTIPEGYSDWKAMIEKDYGGPGVSYIHIIFKTSDPNFKLGTENFVTHEKFPGYSSIFAFTAWTKTAHAKAEKECKNNPTPDCPQTIIGENDKYIFDASMGNGVPPKDLEALRKMLDSSGDIGKALDFKALP